MVMGLLPLEQNAAWAVQTHCIMYACGCSFQIGGTASLGLTCTELPEKGMTNDAIGDGLAKHLGGCAK